MLDSIVISQTTSSSKWTGDSELDSLTTQLTRLVSDPSLRSTVGAQAAAWAKSAFSGETYIARLVPLLKEVARLRPMLRTAAHFGHAFF